MTSLFTKLSRLPESKRKRVKEALDLLESEQCLVSKSDSNPDDRLGLYAQIEELTEQRDELLDVVEKCRAVFDSYVNLHLDKTPPDGEKAARNAFHRGICDNAIARAKGSTS